MRRLLPENPAQELAYTAGGIGLLAGVVGMFIPEAALPGGHLALGMWLSALWLDLRTFVSS